MKPSLHKGMTDFTSGYVPPVTPDGFRPDRAPDRRLRGARLVKLIIACVLLFLLSFMITTAALKISKQPPDGMPVDGVQTSQQEETAAAEDVTDAPEDETQAPEFDEDTDETEPETGFDTEDSDG